MDPLAPDSKQRFAINHLNEGDFRTGGLRNYSSYRDPAGFSRQAFATPS
jgi:hypothetical protein